MWNRKTLTLLLALLLSLPLVLASCSGGGREIVPNDTPETDDNEPPDEGTDEEEPPAPPLTPPDAPEPEPPEPEPEPPARDTLVESLVNSLAIRSGPGSAYAAVGVMDKGDMVAFFGKQGSWYVTVYKEKRAYVSAGTSYTKLAYFEKADSKAEACIEIGKTLLGIPYVLGAQRLHWGNGIMNTAFTGKSYDCSSFTQYIYYKAAGVLLDTTTRTQSVQGKYVAKSAIKRGDLMFFTNDSRVNNTGVERIGHVAIYLGNNYILHTSSDYAVIEPISAKRWSYFITARDVLGR